MAADPELQLGNFSYMVNMHAEAAQAQTIPQLQACLGSIARHVLDLQNPVGTEVVLQTSCSNAHNFTLSSAAVVLSPYGQAQVYVDYLPSSLGTPHRSTDGSVLCQVVGPGACLMLPRMH